MKTKNYTSSNKKKVATILAVFIAIAAIVAGYLVFAKLQDKWPFEHEAVGKVEEDKKVRGYGDVNYEEPTEQEVIDSQDAKKRATEESGSNNKQDDNVSSNKKNISLGVSSSSVYGQNLEIRAFTTDVIEGTGTCTAVLTKGNLKVEKSGKAFIDSTSSICEPIYIPVKSFASKGSWDLVLKYDSPTSSGYTKSIEVQIP